MTTDELAKSMVDAGLAPALGPPNEHLLKMAKLWMMRRTIVAALRDPGRDGLKDIIANDIEQLGE